MNTTDWALTALVVVMASLAVRWALRLGPRVAAGVGAALAAWLTLTGLLATRGLLDRWDAFPPRVPLLPLVTLATLLVVRRTTAFQRLVASTPLAWPLAVQVFRVGVELLLLRLFLEGRAPRQLTFEGWNFDVLVGLTAPVVAWWLSRRPSPALGAAWNLAGIAVLLTTMGIATTSSPGPLHGTWSGAPLTELARFPWVWLPAFLAPFAVAAHVVSLSQHLRQLRAAEVVS